MSSCLGSYFADLPRLLAGDSNLLSTSIKSGLSFDNLEPCLFIFKDDDGMSMYSFPRLLGVPLIGVLDGRTWPLGICGDIERDIDLWDAWGYCLDGVCLCDAINEAGLARVTSMPFSGGRVLSRGCALFMASSFLTTIMLSGTSGRYGL